MKEKESIRTLKGVGEKTEKLFQKVGISTVGQLLRYYPRDYDIYREPVTVESLNDQETGAVLATLTSSLDMKKVRNLTVISGTIADATGRCRVTWFNQPYLRNQLRRGMTFVFRGKISKKGNLSVMEQPEVCTPAAYEEKLNSMQPKYALTAGLSNNMVTKMVRAALEQLDLSQDYLPEEIRLEYELAEYNFAAVQIHFPSDQEQYLEARKRLAFDEFLLFIMGLKQLKEQNAADKNHYRMKEVWKTEEVMENLPYQLTGAQKNVWYEIEQDLRGEKLMTRLVQGDVGSGKTMVAAAAAYCAARNGAQTALMAPTEILAEQHFASLSALFVPLGVSVALLTGSMTGKQKKDVRERIAAGEVQVVIGTHALLSESTRFDNLGLVITDEQHRFGVGQRSRLSVKGEDPHLLVMSATPIPRTLALILYGDLDVSILDELPPGREPVDTFLVGESYRPRINAFIRKQVAEGHQCFVVCPAVEENEELGIKAASVWAETLQQTVFPDLRIALLHGQMKGAEKEAAMASFARGEADVMVATTVIEVGVDVPNATLMVIEDADRFGLSQLHQLRGRVGRGKAKSYCILTTHNRNPETLQRLKALCKTTDGFKIAEEDLRLRGPGDFFGSRQSGLPAFRVADLGCDLAAMKDAQQASADWIDAYGASDTPEANALRERIGDLFARSEGTMN